MNKKLLIIGALIILVAAIAFLYLKNNDEKTGCDWRLRKDPGMCMTTEQRFYYDGEKCAMDENCGNVQRGPFTTIDECKVQCESKLTLPIDTEAEAIVYAKTIPEVNDFLKSDRRIISSHAELNTSNNVWSVVFTSEVITWFKLEIHSDGTILNKSSGDGRFKK